MSNKDWLDTFKCGVWITLIVAAVSGCVIQLLDVYR